MQVAKKKPSGATKVSTSGRNGKPRSLRQLKAFGLWADRAEVMDPIIFTKVIRTRMEQGNDAR